MMEIDSNDDDDDCDMDSNDNGNNKENTPPNKKRKYDKSIKKQILNDKMQMARNKLSDISQGKVASTKRLKEARSKYKNKTGNTRFEGEIKVI